MRIFDWHKHVEEGDKDGRKLQKTAELCHLTLAPSPAKPHNLPPATGEFLLEKTPYTSEICQLTDQALAFIKTATEGKIFKLILCASYTAEHMAVQTDIARAQTKKPQEAVKQIRFSRKELWRLGKGNLEGVIAGGYPERYVEAGAEGPSKHCKDSI